MPPSTIDRVLARWLKPAVWVGALVPLALLLLAGFTGALSADPVEDVTFRTGKAALVLLLLSLAVTPARRLTGWNSLIGARRTLGLFAFFYACLHFLVYLADQSFSWGYIVEDLAERPYATAGFTALVLLVPLAATSTRGAIRRLGKRWQKLHRLVYAAALLAVVHFLWGVKKDVTEPLLYGAVLLALLAFRLPLFDRRRRPRAAPAPSPTPAE